MRRIALTPVPLLFLACEREPVAPDSVSVPSFAATHTTDNLSIPWGGTLEALCGGEDVFVHGAIHYVQLETVTGSGNHMFSWMGQPQGLKGVGVNSGLPYKFTGVTRETVNSHSDGFPWTDTFVDRFRIIAPGGFQYYIVTTTKVTVNGVGDYVVEFTKTSEECR